MSDPQADQPEHDHGRERIVMLRATEALVAVRLEPIAASPLCKRLAQGLLDVAAGTLARRIDETATIFTGVASSRMLRTST